jgi:hypothetical protein
MSAEMAGALQRVAVDRATNVSQLIRSQLAALIADHDRPAAP